MPIGDIEQLLGEVSEEWAQAVIVILKRARLMHGQDGKIIVHIKNGIPLTVSGEDSVRIVKAKAPSTDAA